MAFPYSSGDVLTAADLNQSSGLVHISTTTIGSTVSSVTVSNCFSSTFDNYKIEVSIDICSALGSYVSKFGATTTNYYSTMYYDGHAGTLTGAARTNNGGFIYTALSSTTAPSSFTMTVFRPYLTKFTQVSGNWEGRDAGGWFSGQLADTNSYTDYVLAADTGTMTGGTIRVYGINNG